MAYRGIISKSNKKSAFAKSADAVILTPKLELFARGQSILATDLLAGRQVSQMNTDKRK